MEEERYVTGIEVDRSIAQYLLGNEGIFFPHGADIRFAGTYRYLVEWFFGTAKQEEIYVVGKLSRRHPPGMRSDIYTTSYNTVLFIHSLEFYPCHDP